MSAATFVEGTLREFRHAVRILRRNPAFSTTVVLTLALGIGATTAMFAVIYAFLLRPLPYAEPDKLVMLQSRGTRTGNDLGVNYLDFIDWQKQNRSFSDIAFFNLRWNGNLESPGGMTETLKTTFTTANILFGSSSGGMQASTIEIAVTTNPVDARAIATGLPPGTRITSGPAGSRCSTIIAANM